MCVHTYRVEKRKNKKKLIDDVGRFACGWVSKSCDSLPRAGRTGAHDLLSAIFASAAVSQITPEQQGKRRRGRCARMDDV